MDNKPRNQTMYFTRLHSDVIVKLLPIQSYEIKPLLGSTKSMFGQPLNVFAS